MSPLSSLNAPSPDNRFGKRKLRITRIGANQSARIRVIRRFPFIASCRVPPDEHPQPWQLRHIQQGFENWLRIDLSGDDPPATLTVPVFFNAWRFEAEEHLIIPLLKTTQQRLQRLAAEQASHQDTTARTRNWFKDKAKRVGNSAMALAYGLKGQLNIPGGLPGFPLAQIGFDPTQVRAEYGRRVQARQAFIDGLSSLYFDFETEITRLTGYDGDGNDGGRLNLLFLIDDLDRCLPEKAVRMLESIKLFLDIQGCAFVLALDDEVVERGIAWRYRDYGPGSGQTAMESIARSLNPDHYRDFVEGREPRPANPITGLEYLEKIIQLPMRVPVPSEHQVESYLIHHFGQLFGPSETDVGSPVKPDRAKPDRELHGTRRDRTAKDETHCLLRNLIRRAVPRVPRKLNRVGELYELCLQVARENGWVLEDRAERLTLLRLTILQLLAPDLFRFGRRNPVFLAKLEAWKQQFSSGEGLDLGRLEDELKAKITANEKQLQENPENATAAGDLYSLKHIDLPLLNQIRAARQQRSGFDPLRLIDLDQPATEQLAPFFSLDKPLAPVEASFGVLLERVRTVPEFVQMDWLELIAPHLSAEQLFALYKESLLLTRLAKGLKSA